MTRKENPTEKFVIGVRYDSRRRIRWTLFKWRMWCWNVTARARIQHHEHGRFSMSGRTHSSGTAYTRKGAIRAAKRSAINKDKAALTRQQRAERRAKIVAAVRGAYRRLRPPRVRTPNWQRDYAAEILIERPESGRGDRIILTGVLRDD